MGTSARSTAVVVALAGFCLAGCDDEAIFSPPPFEIHMDQATPIPGGGRITAADVVQDRELTIRIVRLDGKSDRFFNRYQAGWHLERNGVRIKMLSDWSSPSWSFGARWLVNPEWNIHFGPNGREPRPPAFRGRDYRIVLELMHTHPEIHTQPIRVLTYELEIEGDLYVDPDTRVVSLTRPSPPNTVLDASSTPDPAPTATPDTPAPARSGNHRGATGALGRW